jgi:hypothetical protein
VSDLSYFTGRTFETLDQGQDDWDWAINLSGGATIRNKDEDRAAPDVEKLDGMILLRPIFGELDTRLQFGSLETMTSEVILTPTKYTISDPIYAIEEMYPQVTADVDDMLPEDPSEDRVATGPEEAGEGEETEITAEEEEK